MEEILLAYINASEEVKAAIEELLEESESQLELPD